MIINTAYDYDKMAQVEKCVQLDVPEKVARQIIKSFVNKMDYNERQIWIDTNITNIVEISEEQLQEDL